MHLPPLSTRTAQLLQFGAHFVGVRVVKATHPDGKFPISITLTDEDGGVPTAAPVETVTNLAPSNLSACLPLTSSVPADTACSTTAAAPDDTNVALFGAFIDPSALDTHTVTIDWGPGWPQASRVETIQLGAADFGYDASRIFDDEGTYPIKVTVTNDDGASSTTTDTLTVPGRPATGTTSSPRGCRRRWRVTSRSSTG